MALTVVVLLFLVGLIACPFLIAFLIYLLASDQAPEDDQVVYEARRSPFSFVTGGFWYEIQSRLKAAPRRITYGRDHLGRFRRFRR
ncbi:MAG: hypothetical protein JF595_05585 [Sphingomonadales bacterium]|nr:hypothetical protein [Sphingomonadales bacterium]